MLLLLLRAAVCAAIWMVAACWMPVDAVRFSARVRASRQQMIGLWLWPTAQHCAPATGDLCEIFCRLPAAGVAALSTRDAQNCFAAAATDAGSDDEHEERRKEPVLMKASMPKRLESHMFLILHACNPLLAYSTRAPWA